jgi:hypothetical protein
VCTRSFTTVHYFDVHDTGLGFGFTSSLTDGVFLKGVHKSWVAEFYIVAPNIYGRSVWKVPCITLLVPRILRWLLDFQKICVPVF